MRGPYELPHPASQSRRQSGSPRCSLARAGRYGQVSGTDVDVPLFETTFAVELPLKVSVDVVDEPVTATVPELGH